MQLSSISLANMSSQIRDKLGEVRCVLIHDLHLDYSRNLAQMAGTGAEGHRRLLEGHLSIEAPVFSENNGPLGMNMLEYAPRPWWRDDIANVVYVLENLCRRLSFAGLLLELGAFMLDLRWISAQGRSGGSLGIKRDYQFLRKALLENDDTETTIRTAIASIPIVLAMSSGSIGKGLRVVSFMLLSGLSNMSKGNEFLCRFLESVKVSTPKPYLMQTVCSYRPPEESLKSVIDLREIVPGLLEIEHGWNPRPAVCRIRRRL